MKTFMHWLESVNEPVVKEIDDNIFFKLKTIGQIKVDQPDSNLVLSNKNKDTFLQCQIRNNILHVVKIDSFWAYISGFISFIKATYPFVNIDNILRLKAQQLGGDDTDSFMLGRHDASMNKFKSFLWLRHITTTSRDEIEDLLENYLPQIIKHLLSRYIYDLKKIDADIVNKIINNQNALVENELAAKVIMANGCDEKCILAIIDRTIKNIIYKKTGEIIKDNGSSYLRDAYEDKHAKEIITFIQGKSNYDLKINYEVLENMRDIMQEAASEINENLFAVVDNTEGLLLKSKEHYGDQLLLNMYIDTTMEEYKQLRAHLIITSGLVDDDKTYDEIDEVIGEYIKQHSQHKYLKYLSIDRNYDNRMGGTTIYNGEIIHN